MLLLLSSHSQDSMTLDGCCSAARKEKTLSLPPFPLSLPLFASFVADEALKERIVKKKTKRRRLSRLAQE